MTLHTLLVGVGFRYSHLRQPPYGNTNLTIFLICRKSEVIEKSVVLITFAVRFRALYNGMEGCGTIRMDFLNIKCYGTYTYLHLDQGNTEF